MRVASDYGCLIEEKGIALRASYLIDPKGVLRQITMNDLPVGRSVDEALRLVQAFQFTVSFFFFVIGGGDGAETQIYKGRTWGSLSRELEGRRQDDSCGSYCQVGLLWCC